MTRFYDCECCFANIYKDITQDNETKHNIIITIDGKQHRFCSYLCAIMFLQVEQQKFIKNNKLKITKENGYD
jgi:hypothetical protein